MTKPVREHKPKSYPGKTKDVDAIVGNSFNFNKALSKFSMRAEAVVHQTAPSQAAVQGCNALAISCLGYWSHLLLPPGLDVRKELRWLNKLLKLPGSCCSSAFFARLGELGTHP